ncbi:MAG TPA: hypothetical protein LFW21_00210 [Rickettsia endosymbiont of Pyrocoelia pectoralis]|nr:hypothetical protein [Rickettsia endosymbiont of Pyrocoelia pectoralis]
MSKDNQGNVLSGEVRGKIEDIKNVDGRLNTLNKNIDPNNDIIQQHLRTEEYITSTLEGLAGKTINEAVTNEKIQELVDNLHNNLKQNLELLPNNADNLKFDVARAEAAVKGFALPLNKGGTFDELLFMGISEQEIFNNPIKATKEALIAVSGQSIPKEQYAQAVKDKAIEILKKDSNITPEQLKKYENFITQGDKNQKYDSKNNAFVPKINNLSQVESQALQEAATNAVQQINNRLDRGKKNGEAIKVMEFVEVKNPQIKNDLLPAISKLPTEKMKEQGSNIIANFTPLLENTNPALVNGAKKALTELDPQYLAEAGDNIKQQLDKASKTSVIQKFMKIFTGKDYAQQNIDKAFEGLTKANNDYKDFQQKLPTVKDDSPALSQSQKLETVLKKEQAKTSSVTPTFVSKVASQKSQKQNQGPGI